VNTANKLQDEWLLSYAAGALDPARSLLVASHIDYHDDLQEAVSDAETIGGSLLEAMQSEHVSNHVLDELMSRIDDAQGPEIKTAAPVDKQYPQPLMDFIDCDMDSLKWRSMGPGMSNARLWNGPNDERLWLLRARGGVRVPEHGHSGDEWTLILKGSYQTAAGQFGVGDIDVADLETVHQPIIDIGEECICLVMTEGPIRLKSLFARMVQPIIGL
jgi:putative transcriptional regulator